MDSHDLNIGGANVGSREGDNPISPLLQSILCPGPNWLRGSLKMELTWVSLPGLRPKTGKDRECGKEGENGEKPAELACEPK